MVFDTKVVLDQLRYTGMLETIRIRKMGYPVRIKFPMFISRCAFFIFITCSIIAYECNHGSFDSLLILTYFID